MELSNNIIIIIIDINGVHNVRTMEASLMKSIPEEYLKLDGKFNSLY